MRTAVGALARMFETGAAADTILLIRGGDGRHVRSAQPRLMMVFGAFFAHCFRDVRVG